MGVLNTETVLKIFKKTYNVLNYSAITFWKSAASKPHG
jgi:hypothetical protein